MLAVLVMGIFTRALRYFKLRPAMKAKEERAQNAGSVPLNYL